MTHPREHEELLERVLGGELARDAAEVQDRCAACAECREELAHLEAVLGTARAAGELQREVIEEALAGKGPRDVELARRALEVARERAPGARRPSRAWLWLAGAAAVALLVFLVPRSTDAPPVLLGDGLELLAPRGAGADPELFSWSFELPPAGHFELRVWQLLPGGGEVLLVERIDLDATTWRPSAPDSLPPGARIRWTVEAYGAGRELLDSAEARAELQPH